MALSGLQFSKPDGIQTENRRNIFYSILFYSILLYSIL
jgi:hypothetical protein